MGERWRPIPGYGGHYEASDYGHIRSLPRVVTKRNRWGQTIEQRYGMRVLSEHRTRDGHMLVRFGVDGRKYSVGVHRLVAMAFHGLPIEGQECCHNNGNPSDNRPENLRWDTHAANNADRKVHGNYAVGENHHQSRFSRALVAAVMGGDLTRAQAVAQGVSPTHYYRLRRQTAEWFARSYGTKSQEIERG